MVVLSHVFGVEMNDNIRYIECYEKHRCFYRLKGMLHPDMTPRCAEVGGGGGAWGTREPVWKQLCFDY